MKIRTGIFILKYVHNENNKTVNAITHYAVQKNWIPH